MRKAFLVLAVVTALTAGIFAASTSAPKTTSVTVGDFAVKVAKAMGYSPADQQAAVKSLKTSGVNLDAGEIGSRLTEGKAAQILGDLGIKVRTSDAASPLSPAKSDQLVTAVSLSSASAASVTPSADLNDCLALRNRGQCETCCKVFYGCDLNLSCDFAKACTRTCSAVVPPGLQSSPEPQP
ncbi:MAG TPA: hypothetical protein VFT43_11115 [Candidatus Polarisedimenticolia bacterium]|nr:hypothetical protein [Candidatus Polarisedimenticolia bacterium]